MTWLLPITILAVTACADDGPRPSLEGPYECGPNTCGSGQVCVTKTSGSQCGVGEGIGPYETYDWECADLPAGCDGRPSCECFYGEDSFCGVSDDQRTIGWHCI